jgi:multidrug resistance efflux pump
LQRAIVEREVEDAMDIEDDILTELQTLERTIEQERLEKEKAQAEIEKSHAEIEKIQAEKVRLQQLLKQAGIDDANID